MSVSEEAALLSLIRRGDDVITLLPIFVTFDLLTLGEFSLSDEAAPTTSSMFDTGNRSRLCRSKLGDEA